MFSSVSERKMLSVRGFLLAAWLILIGSLFWDPWSESLTRPDNLLSPFRVTNHEVVVQDHTLTAAPYSLGARIFWTMAVPIVPLFLMVFGHEAWRRICPLSLASQIPGYAGFRRFRSKLDRRTGLISRKIPLISPTGWLARHTWYVQFGMLFSGVTVRLLIINTDRHAMGVVLLGVIFAAMLTGFLWGGKTWCNYFCPANIVQKIYTEPGGILESAPHYTRTALPQSMCRKPSPKGDVSACVACTANCGDIDLQRSYWTGVLDPQRRNVYYMFFGLILGFYGFYFLYSGNWDYYFSGIWTHEDGVAGKILAPGLFLLGQVVNVPKIIVAPGTLAVCCALSLGLGRGLEGIYRRYRSKKDSLSDKLIVHHCLSVSAWASINAFYLFGGRPNILLLPALGGRVVDIAIVALTTIWLRQALHQTPTRYQQESMASGLLAELKKLKINVGKFLEGRKLENLRADEVYLLTKVLPGFSQHQKLDAYRKILDEAVSNGATASSASLKLLQEFRLQMNITEEEHVKLLEELGLAHIADVDVVALSDEEKTESLHHYRGILSGTVASRIDGGMSITDILVDPSFLSTIEVLRQSLQIGDADHEAVIAELSSQNGLVSAKMDDVLEILLRQKSMRMCMEAAVISDPLGQSLLDLLHDALDAHEHAIRIESLSILRNFGPEPQFKRHAEDLASLCGRSIDLILRQAVPSRPTVRWRDTLHPAILAILLGGHVDQTVAAAANSGEAQVSAGPRSRRSHRAALLGSLNVEDNLLQLLSFDDPLIRAIGLMVFGYIDAEIAAGAARNMVNDVSEHDHPMLVAVVRYMAGVAVAEDEKAGGASIRAILRMPGQPDRRLSTEKAYVTIGRAPDNDIAVTHALAWTYHIAVSSLGSEVRLLRLDEGSVFVNGRQVLAESVSLRKGSVVSLGAAGGDAPAIEIDWDLASERGSRMTVHPVLRLAMLARNIRLGHLPLPVLADIALRSRVERYVRGAKLESADGEAHLLVQQGEVRLFDPATMDFVSGIGFGPGDLIGPELANRDALLLPEIGSDFAVVVQVPATADVCAATPRFDPAAHLLAPARAHPRSGHEPRDGAGALPRPPAGAGFSAARAQGVAPERMVEGGAEGMSANNGAVIRPGIGEPGDRGSAGAIHPRPRTVDIVIDQTSA